MTKNVWITIKKELRGIIRDKKSLLMMLVGPIMIPIFIFLFSNVYDGLMNDINQEKVEIGINYEINEIEKSILKDLKIEAKQKGLKQLEKDYKEKKISAYITKKDNVYTIHSNPNDQDGMNSSAMATAYLEQYNTALGSQFLVEEGIELEKVYQNIEIKTDDLEGNSSMVDMILYMGFVFAMMSICLTAIYGVTDTTAGEKERGTLETFLTFPIKSEELITGKFLAITISCIITSIISTALLVGSIEISRTMFDIYKDVTIHLNLGTIFLVLLIMINISFFISGLCIAIASFTKTYKEAQSALTPVSFITMVPMFFDILEVKLNYGLAMIPIVSHTMLLDAAISNTLSGINITYLLISLVSTILYSFILIKIITRMYKSEKVLFTN